MRRVSLVVHNIRSALNVGSILRTAEGLGAEKVYLTGYTPYPETENDSRLPHLRQRQALQIHKTALGAEYYMNWQYEADINSLLKQLTSEGYTLMALEQTPKAEVLDKIDENTDIALVLGNEVTGLEKNVLKQVSRHVQIPMRGRKESFNVAVAAAIAMYHLIYQR